MPITIDRAPQPPAGKEPPYRGLAGALDEQARPSAGNARPAKPQEGMIMTHRMKALRPQMMASGGICPQNAEFLEDDPQRAAELVRAGKALDLGEEQRQVHGPSETQERQASETKAPSAPAWKLRQTPAEYLAANPKGPMAQLARDIIAAAG